MDTIRNVIVTISRVARVLNRPGRNEPPVPAPPVPLPLPSPSQDALTNEVGEAIENAYGGIVVGYDVPFQNPATGEQGGDSDVLLTTNVSIQVKSGNNLGGLVGQVQRQEAMMPGVRVIGYAPNAPRAAIASAQRQGVEVYTRLDDLLRAIRPPGQPLPSHLRPGPDQ